MATSIQLRPANRDLGMVMREVDEDLAIFLGIRNGDKERSPGPRLGETGKSDHDWYSFFSQQDADEPTAAPDISVEHLPAKDSKESPPLAATTPTLPAKTNPSRAPSNSKPVSRSSTPSRATSKPASRSARPTSKPATPSTTSTMTASDGSSSGRKTVSASTKNPVSQNLKTSLPRRPASASRGRPNAVASLSSSSKGKPRQNSCSPTKLRAAHRNGSRPLSRSRGYSHGGGDDVNPILMGTQMVERVVNMRKLAPPKQQRHTSLHNPKKSSHENSGFGRSLSNRSLDMAIRHMDIRRSVAGNLRPVATSSTGNQSSSSQSSESSKSSNCVNSYFLDD